MSGTFTVMTGAGTKLTRPLKWLAAMLRHPLRLARMLVPYKLVAAHGDPAGDADLDSAMHLRPKRKLFGRGVRLQTEQDPERPNPTFIPAADAGGAMVRRADRRRSPRARHRGALQHPDHRPHPRRRGDRPRDPSTASSTRANRVFGYENLLVCDGAAIPANPGVNPSLTITALAEHAMSLIPPKTEPSRATCPRRRGRHSVAP